MLKKLSTVLLLLFVAGFFCGAAGKNIIPHDRMIRVQYQSKSSSSKSWSNGSTSMKGHTSESMIRNELKRRMPNCKIRVLAVDTGKPVSHFVRFQTSTGGKTWSNGSTLVQNALTESMAKNQIMQRNPGKKVRILSMTPR